MVDAITLAQELNEKLREIKLTRRGDQEKVPLHPFEVGCVANLIKDVSPYINLYTPIYTTCTPYIHSIYTASSRRIIIIIKTNYIFPISYLLFAYYQQILSTYVTKDGHYGRRDGELSSKLVKVS